MKFAPRSTTMLMCLYGTLTLSCGLLGQSVTPPAIVVNRRPSIAYPSASYPAFSDDPAALDVSHSPPLTGPASLGPELFALVECPSSMLIHVHGFDNDLSGAQDNAQTLRDSADSVGYRGQVVGFAWNSNPGVFQFDAAEEAADYMAEEFANFLKDVWQRWPAMPIYITGHSLGSRVVLGALNELADPPNSTLACIYGVALFGAAVDNESLGKGNEFSPGVTAGGSTPGTPNAPPVKVWVNSEDDVLSGTYWLEELDQALGEDGIEDKSDVPAHVSECDAKGKIMDSGEDPDNHSSYIKSKKLVEATLRNLGVPLQ